MASNAFRSDDARIRTDDEDYDVDAFGPSETSDSGSDVQGAAPIAGAGLRHQPVVILDSSGEETVVIWPTPGRWSPYRHIVRTHIR